MTPARFPNGTERRAAVELRVAAGRRLEGYASIFGVPSQIGSFKETVLRGAFTETLRSRPDILCLVDHSTEKLLSRTASGTLRLSEDAKGLHFDMDAPDTALGRDVLALAERGDIGGASIGFRVRPGGEAWPARDRRELRALDLIEISVVHAFPAAIGTSVTARSRQPGALAAVRRRRAWLSTL